MRRDIVWDLHSIYYPACDAQTVYYCFSVTYPVTGAAYTRHVRTLFSQVMFVSGAGSSRSLLCLSSSSDSLVYLGIPVHIHHPTYCYMLDIPSYLYWYVCSTLSVYIYIYIYIYICIHMHTYIYIYIYTYI